jgi:hypothetical protein
MATICTTDSYGIALAVAGTVVELLLLTLPVVLAGSEVMVGCWTETSD